MAHILVLCSSAGAQPGSPVAEALALGARLAGDLNGELVAGVFGADTAAASAVLAGLGPTRVHALSDPRLERYTGDLALAAAHRLVQSAEADIVLVASDADCVEWAPRLAARLKAGLVTACESVRVDAGRIVAGRKLSGGVLRAEYLCRTPKQVLMLAPGTDWGEVAPASACAVEAVALGDVASRVDFVDFVADMTGDGPPLKSARVVVSGGLGIGSADNWHIVEDAAATIGGAVGASRAAVEAGWVASNRQVGFSGLKVGPDLYIAAGISGALHHLAGIGRAKKIVAINRDAEAPIFKSSHIAVIGDVAEVLPAFSARARELQG